MEEVDRIKILIEEAKSTGTSQERLKYLAGLRVRHLLFQVLKNPITGPKILMEWIDLYPHQVLAHPNCPVETLYCWLERGNSSSLTHLGIVRNPVCPTEILVNLLWIYGIRGGEFSKLMVKKVEEHPNFPKDLVEWSLGLDEW